MFKTVIAPIQAWLLSRGQCVACGTALSKATSISSDASVSKVACKCGRIFIYDKLKKTYRRALFSEI